MNFIEQLSQIKRLHDLIRRKATGTPEELASRLRLSRATTYRYIETLKILGAPVKYCRNRQCFFYEEEYELIL